MRLILTLLSLFWAFVLVLVGGRFLALLLNADGSTQLISQLYRYSDWWVKPFFTVFHLANKAVDQTGGVFEPASLIAFIVYFAIGALVINLVRNSGEYYHGHYGHA